VDLAEERQKVVFAQTEHLNILDDHQLPWSQTPASFSS
jgi:hypothetical protein